MILSVSRRTDIPAFYSDWFVNRLRGGYVLVPNPYSPRHLSRISLSPAQVDCIVFWTKNAAPMLSRLKEVEELGYANYYFEFTLTPYDASIEKNLPPKNNLIRTFRQLSDQIGPSRVDWRFDPIVLTQSFTASRLLDRFEDFAKQLAVYTERCIISFVDIYRSIRSLFQEIAPEKKAYIAEHLAEIAASYRLKLYACGEAEEYKKYGIYPSACIDRDKIEHIVGYKLRCSKDTTQRKHCQCVESVDIGIYDTCRHGCTYCYATRTKRAEAGSPPSDPFAPMLTGYPLGTEAVTERKMVALKDPQRTFRYTDSEE